MALSKTDIAQALLGKRRVEDATTHETQTHLITGTATADSSSGIVPVDFGGYTIAADGSQAVPVSTLSAIREGDTVIAAVVGKSETAKTPTVVGTPGGGDRAIQAYVLYADPTITASSITLSQSASDFDTVLLIGKTDDGVLVSCMSDGITPAVEISDVHYNALVNDFYIKTAIFTISGTSVSFTSGGIQLVGSNTKASGQYIYITKVIGFTV